MSTYDHHPHAALIKRLFEALEAGDATAMAGCYHPDATFHDPVFSLMGQTQIAAMWTMLCHALRQHSSDHWRITLSGVEADADHGQARWEPQYRFSGTGRLVHNIIQARFRFQGGLILRHQDDFQFWRWTRQALGWRGTLLGWTPMLRNSVRSQALSALVRYMPEVPTRPAFLSEDQRPVMPPPAKVQ